MTYTTIGDARPAQRRNGRSCAGSRPATSTTPQAPTAWDVDFQTAVAQAEQEDREVAGAYHRLAFAGPDGATIEVDTTRPGAAAGLRRAGRAPGRRALPAPFRHVGDVRRCSTCRCRSTRTGWPTPPRAPASRWCARSATRPTCSGSANSACRSGRSSAATVGCIAADLDATARRSAFYDELVGLARWHRPAARSSSG